MKKPLCLLFAAAALILAGCSKSDSEKTVGTPENPYKIVWYSFGEKPQDLEKVMEKVNEYTQKKIGVTVDLKMGMSDYAKKIQLVQSSGEPFDLCFTSSWINDYWTSASRGFFLPLNELIDKYGQELKKEINPLFFEGTKIDGINYAVPINKEIAYQLGFRFNKKYVEKYNFDLSKIKGLADIEPMFEVIKAKEPGIIPFCAFGGSYQLKNQDYLFYSMLPGMVEIKPKNYKVENQYYNKTFLDYMNLYRKYYLKGYIPQDALRMNTSVSGLEKSGKWFCDRVAYLPGVDEVFKRQLGFETITIPAFEPPIIANKSVAGAMVAISSTSERPDLCMKFLNLLNSDKYLRNLLGYGIEGVHYKKISDNRIELLENAKNYQMPQFVLGNVYLTYVVAPDPENKWEEYKKWDNSAVKSPILGFAFNVKPVKNEMSSIQNTVQEYGHGLFVGEMNPETTLPVFLQKMKDGGVDKILGEMQKQIDEWWTKNKK